MPDYFNVTMFFLAQRRETQNDLEDEYFKIFKLTQVLKLSAALTRSREAVRSARGIKPLRRDFYPLPREKKKRGESRSLFNIERHHNVLILNGKLRKWFHLPVCLLFSAKYREYCGKSVF